MGGCAATGYSSAERNGVNAMSLKNLIVNNLPAYRNKNAIMEELAWLKTDNAQLVKRLEMLDEKNEYLFWLTQNKPGESLQETKQRYFMQLPKATGELREIQLAENSILQELKGICDVSNLHFWFAGGTLLGAYRHKGFIPWDDDIDLYMMRQDAMTLYELLRTNDELSMKRYFVGSGGSLYKVKRRSSDGVFVDVFTFDLYDATDMEMARERWTEVQNLAGDCAAKMKKQMLFYGESVEKHNNTPFPHEQLETLFYPTYNDVMQTLPYYGHGNYAASSLYDRQWDRANTSYWHVSDLFPLIENGIEFEGLMYDCIQQPLKFLTRQYGDIWRFPKSVNPVHLSEMDESGEE